MIQVGIIGGSGLDDPNILQQAEEVTLTTPFGAPSSPITRGVIDGQRVLLLARHGRRHQYSPSQVNYRANIHALKELGATHIVATTACGSLREEIDRGHFVILDQFIDFTRKRANTFHEDFSGGAVHTGMATPFDAHLRKVLYETSMTHGNHTHEKGTVVTIEGPRFSTRAESRMFRAWGADVINMSVATEAALANEAGIPYAAVAMSTDYDCWKEDEAPVSWEEILEVFHKNTDRVKGLLTKAIPRIGKA
ncbi:S-methyl-5'-thioadenosine phosphorylase [Desulfoluna spongiiphila]|uniref:S-methyl-5'-thioadenosine phosphorylase n=1 Tax=Desulfoluna spongiiphila TaxID=419481 RepID=UPI001254B5EA|nr:S-methyl-5'-thioadenosine phosphorylase [Desulfoluna spongiiphila]VVS93114.1 methylthioadenosine phosphorylase (mtap) [Desulfoluna spongiiphila]